MNSFILAFYNLIYKRSADSISAANSTFNHFFLRWPARIWTNRMRQNIIISPHHALRKECIYSQDVEYIEVETDRLDDRIGFHGASLHHSRVCKNILRTAGVKHMSIPIHHHAKWRGNILLENKPAEDSETAVQRDGFADRESTGSQGKSHGCPKALSATTVTPVRSGPPQLRYLSFLDQSRQRLLVS